MSVLLCHVIVLPVERHMLPSFRHGNFHRRKRGNMSALRRLRAFWILWVTAMVLACFSNAVAQARYKVQDLGVQHPDNLGMAMGLNNNGWTLNMEQLLDHSVISTLFPAVQGTVRISVGELNRPLGTLGGKNSSINWNGINDRGESVGMSETSFSDPNGEDLCGFGTHATCLPFLWQNGVMQALPTLGGNNGQASGINNRGQAVGYSGTCTAANFAVVWENGAATPLADLGTPGAIAFAINGHNQIVGQAVNSEGTALAAIWENNTVRSLGVLLPGDAAAFATSINNRGQVVGSSFDSSGNWSHGLIWENGRMFDLNQLFPASSNLYVISASNINESGQIAGMAVEMAGPHAGTIVHSFLATPVNEDQGKTVADVVGTLPKITVPAANVSKLSPKSAHCSIQR